jgi:hypothetical protein
MQKRKHVKHIATFEEKLAEEARLFRAAAEHESGTHASCSCAARGKLKRHRV